MSESKTTFRRGVIDAIISHEPSRLGPYLELRDDGVWVIALPKPSRPPTTDDCVTDVEYMTDEEMLVRVAHPDNDLNLPALPFPFTEDRFRAFCIANPQFAWNCTIAPYTNDDDGLDEVGLARLMRFSPDAERLVRGWLEQWLSVKKRNLSAIEWEAWNRDWLERWRARVLAGRSDAVLQPVPAPTQDITGSLTSSMLVAREDDIERQDRRLTRLQALGGDRVRSGASWRNSGRGTLAKLVTEEKAAGRPYSDDRDVRRDLDAAAERRHSTRTMPKAC